jgi:hypothetical protein
MAIRKVEVRPDGTVIVEYDAPGRQQPRSKPLGMAKKFLPTPQMVVAHLLAHWIALGISALVTGTFALSAVWKQNVLRAQAQSGLHLDPASSVIAAIPTWLFLTALGLAFIAIWLLLFRSSERKSDHAVVTDDSVRTWQARTLQDTLGAEPPAGPPALGIQGVVTRFEQLNWEQLSDSDFGVLEEAWKDPTALMRFNALIELTNSGIPSRARNWQFTAKRQDGTPLELSPADTAWHRPSPWRDVDYWTLDRIQDEYLKPETTYQVFICLTVRGLIGPDLPNIVDSFRAAFRDDSGSEIVCTRAYG